MRIVTLLGGISFLLLPACTTMNIKKNSENESKNHITQARIFHESTKTGCSLSSTAKNESFGAAIATAIVPELIGSGIDILSEALESASRKDKESQEILSLIHI